jgi:urea transport system substrate-binding protein
MSLTTKLISGSWAKRALAASTTVAVVLLAACSSSGSTNAAVAKSEPVRVGFILALTGAGAGLAPTTEAGMKAATTALSANPPGGHKLEIFIADDASDPTTAALQCTRLVKQDKVVAIVALENEPNYIACNTVAGPAGIPLIQSTGGAGPYCAPNFFNTGPTNQQQVSSLIDFLSSRGSKKFYLLGTTTASVTNTFAVATKLIEADGGSVVGSSTEPFLTSDWSSDLSKVASSGADTLVLNIIDAVAFYKQLVTTPLFKKLTLADLDISPNQATADGVANVSGVYAIAQYLPNIDTPASQAFVSQVEKQSKLDPDEYTAETYYSVMLLAQSIKKAGSDVTASKLIAGLRGSSYTGPAGTWTYTTNNFMNVPTLVYQFHADGSWTILKSTDLPPGACG